MGPTAPSLFSIFPLIISFLPSFFSTSLLPSSLFHSFIPTLCIKFLMLSRTVQIHFYYRALGFGEIITTEIGLMHFDATGKCHSQSNLPSAVVTGVTQSKAVGRHYTKL